MDLVSVFNMGARDVFDFAFRPGEGFTDLRQMEGKTVLLGSAAWQSIADPIFAAAGADVTKISISKLVGPSGEPFLPMEKVMPP